MAPYPSLDQYNDAVQHPRTAFTDAALRSSKIATNGMGLPLALGGGFALTYTATAQGRKFAVRCFHKEAKGLEQRYAAIHQGLKKTASSYFLGFEFQKSGVLVNGSRYPIVKMDWAEGDTLGTYIEDNHTNKARIDELRARFVDLERFLRLRSIAHGDLQNGNVIVRNGIKLIDYDGMYVAPLQVGQGTEVGHKHFQHPKRSASDFGPAMDRFSFIVIELSLRAVLHNPKLFARFSNGENIILAASDFIDPANSQAFSEIGAISSLSRNAENLASICRSAANRVPVLEDFLAGRNIPAAPIKILPPKPTGEASPYISAYDVIDAQNFEILAKYVGDRVELIGIVTKVHVGRTKYGKPFTFVFFNDSRKAVKLNIWSEGLERLPSTPTASWKGKWLSVQGLVDAPYTGRYGTSLSITITSSSQFREITAAEGQRRLRSKKAPATGSSAGNRGILDDLKGGRTGREGAGHAVSSSRDKNKAILNAIAAGQRQPAPPIGSAPKPIPSPPHRRLPWGWLITGGIILLWLLLLS